MYTGIVSVKGQVVIPSKIRRRMGIKKGTKICFLEKGDEVSIRPLTKDYFEKMAGVLKTGGRLTKIILDERSKDKSREA